MASPPVLMPDFELSPVQHRIIEALHTHERALLLTPGGIGRRTAIVHALPVEGPIVWIGSRLSPVPELVERHRPGLKVTLVSKKSLSRNPPGTSTVAGGTLVIGASAGTWLGNGGKRCLAVRGLAAAATRVWAHGSTVSKSAEIADRLMRIKFDMGLDFAPLAMFDSVISFGWNDVRTEPPEFDPEPPLTPIDLDSLDEAPHKG